MPESPFYPEKVLIEAKSLDYPLTQRILNNLSGIPRVVIRGKREKQAAIGKILGAKDPLQEGKKHLFLAVQKGKFVKPCPCTPHYIGCRYFIINLNLQCPLDCAYCILQNYLAEPWITVFVNLEDLWQELDGFLEKNKNRFLRIGTGELGDSLALDHFTLLSRDLIYYFRKRPDVFLELKTKTINIRNILALEPQDNIVISWSLNTEKMARAEEKGSPPVRARLEAARCVAERGYPVGFHFDPLIRHAGWRKGCAGVVRDLLAMVPASRIAWISLGSLRFPPHLKKTILARFPGTKTMYEEFIAGQDGKLRYFKPLRMELFQHVAGLLRKWGGKHIPLYLCMENAEIWRDVIGWIPKGKRHVENALSPRT